MQYKKDLERPKEQRRWLRCEIADDGNQVFIVLATQEMLKIAAQYGDGRALYMDATHGCQRYGLMTVTVLVKDHERRGDVPQVAAQRLCLQRCCTLMLLSLLNNKLHKYKHNTTQSTSTRRNAPLVPTAVHAEVAGQGQPHALICRSTSTVGDPSI
jgi:hypothetical protein